MIGREKEGDAKERRDKKGVSLGRQTHEIRIKSTTSQQADEV